MPLTRQFDVVGVSEPTTGPLRGDPPPKDWPECVEKLPDLGIYHKPDRGPNSEKLALQTLYSNQREEDSEESLSYLLIAQERIVSELPDVPELNLSFGLLPSPIQYLDMVAGLNPDSHAGYPWCREKLDKRPFVLKYFSEVYEIMCVRILALYHVFDSNKTYTPRELYELHFCDSYFVKIKNEIIKIGKNPRIIAVVGVIDELIERVYLKDVSLSNTEWWGEFYSCVGIGFTQSDTDRFLKPFEGKTTANNDTPSMDVTRTLNECMLDADATRRQIGLTESDPMSKVILAKAYCAATALFTFQDGEVWSQNISGCTKTGQFGTSTDNTKSRARRGYAVDCKIQSVDPHFESIFRCQGDDANEIHHPLKEQTYAELGFPLRNYTLNKESVSFCSHDFTPGQAPIGQRIFKSVANLLYRNEIDDERLRAFVTEFRNHPLFSNCASVILAMRPRMKYYSKSNHISMSKNKQKKNRSKRPRRKNPRSGRSQQMTAGTVPFRTNTIARIQRPRGMMLNSYYERVCSQINPFCAEAVGAKIYDVSSAKTLTSCVRTLVNILTNSEGQAFYSFIPSLITLGSVASTISGGTVTAITSLGAVPNYSDYLANCKSYRIVSYGCRFVPTANAMIAQGAMVVTEVDSLFSTGLNISSVNLGPVNIVRSVPGDSLFFVSRVTDLNYTDFKSIDNADSYLQRTSCTMGFTGCEYSTYIGVVEVIMNVEFLPQINTLGALFPTTAQVSNPAIMNTAANVARSMKPLYSGTEAGLSSVILDEVKSIAGTAVKAGGNALRGSIMAALMP